MSALVAALRASGARQTDSESELKLTDGSVRSAFFHLWLPMIGGVLAVKAIGVSDAYFVGQLGEDALASISFTFPVVMTLISLAIGLSAGASSVLSRAVGDDATKVEQAEIVTGAIGFALVIAAIIMVLGLFGMRYILMALGAAGDALDDANLYMQIWSVGAVFLILPIEINGLLRAVGDGMSPAILMTVVAGVNIAINPVFIFGLGPVPAFDMQGAAIATVIARAFGLIFALWLIHRKGLLTLDPARIKSGLSRWREVARIGAPASLSTSLNPISISVITAAVATLGSAEVAAFGLVTKIQSFALVPLLALSSATAPFVGQNSGAGEIKRSRKSLYLAGAISMAWAAILAIFFFLFGKPLLGLFVDSKVVQDTAAQYLMIVPLSYAGYGIVISLSAALNGLGRSIQATFVSGGRAIALLAPLAAGGTLLFGFIGTAIGIAIANMLSGLGAFVVARRHPLSETSGQKSDGDMSECD